MSWVILVEVGLKLVGFLMGFWKEDKEVKKWMLETAEGLRQKRLVRQSFVANLSDDRDKYINEMLDEMEKPEGKDD